jgi:ATP-dependent DNA helicase RecG
LPDLSRRFFSQISRIERRNEIIADIFHRIHFIEKWGRGISLILEREPTAIFKEVADIFITVFERKNYDPKDEFIHEKEVTKELGEGLVENQKKILELISNDAYISKKKMAEILGISTTAVDKNIETLKEKGLLRRIGSAKAGHWQIIK